MLSAVNLQTQAFDQDEESSLDDLLLDYNERMEEMEEESRLECDQDGCHQPKNAKPNAPMLTKLGQQQEYRGTKLSAVGS